VPKAPTTTKKDPEIIKTKQEISKNKSIIFDPHFLALMGSTSHPQLPDIEKTLV
jgi:hypothetical protein